MMRSPLGALHRALLRALLACAVLLVAACGTESARGGPGSGLPASPAVISSLDDAKAAWAAFPAAQVEYRLTIVQQCFCPRIALDVTVNDGKVVREEPLDLDNTGGGQAPAVPVGFPRTVADLHAVIAGSAEAASTIVTYDSHGVPLRISIDSIANAVDDEVGYAVSFASVAGGEAPPADDGTWSPASLPAGARWQSDLPLQGQRNGQAAIIGSGSDARVVIGLWGSSSCPEVPRTLRLQPSSTPSGGAPGFIRAFVGVDATSPEGMACTADYGPTVYAARLPSEVAAVLRVPDPAAESGSAIIRQATTLVLVVETVTGAPGRTGSTTYALDPFVAWPAG